MDSLPAGIESATDLLYYNRGYADGEIDLHDLTPGDRRFFQGATVFHEEHLRTWLQDRWTEIPSGRKTEFYTRGWLAAVSRPQY